ncbi:alpha/beta fold hydrolase [Mycobacterium sp. NPDC050853]|uniref:alpha/beta fold hydrolase n=1 Tax=Mycobacteriaceae TaxID=1762 RepID=UPI0015DD6146|nr:alpha/beta hydrolase [Mycobacteroides sp. LB1]
MTDTAVDIRERDIATNGVRLRTLEAGEPGQPVVVLAHGFPELAYSWRHQIPTLAAAGYHVIAPDQRGYGGSSAPEHIDDYNIEALSDDLLGILDDVGASKATLVGHDWGAVVTWHTALAVPERVEGVAGLSVPFTRRSQVAPTQAWKKLFGDNFFYILYFQEPGVADAELNRDPAATMRCMLAGMAHIDGATMIAPGPAGFIERMTAPEQLPGWLSEAELDHYTAEFASTGFTGGLNWYRNFDRNWALTQHLVGADVVVPSLFIAGTADPVLGFTDHAGSLKHRIDNRGDIMIEGAGHWIQQERPQEVNAALLEFLRQVAQ